MKWIFSALMFNVASNKDNMYHYPHCPFGQDNWCKYNADRTNNIKTYKPGPDLPKEIFWKTRSISLELSKDTESKKCWHGKKQNGNEIFNGPIWECIPKNIFGTLRNLEFSVYDAVAHFNIGTKALFLIYE